MRNDKQKDGFKSMGYTSKGARFFLGVTIIIIGILYLIIQWLKKSRFIDFLFVFLATMATILLLNLLKGIFNFTSKNRSKINFIDSTGKSEEIAGNFKSFLKLLTCRNFTTLFGLIWGVIAGLLPFLLNFWPGDFLLKSLFSLYLLFVCFVTGLSAFLLIAYYVYTMRIWNQVEIKVWYREDQLVNFLMKLGRKVSIGTSLYISLTLTCWVTSPVVPPGNELNTYVAFSIFILLATLLFPLILLVKKVRDAKARELQTIDTKIQAKYLEMLKEINLPEKNVNFQFFNSLVELRDRINNIKIVPDKFASILSVIGIIVINIVPVVFRLIVEKVLK